LGAGSCAFPVVDRLFAHLEQPRQIAGGQPEASAESAESVNPEPPLALSLGHGGSCRRTSGKRGQLALHRDLLILQRGDHLALLYETLLQRPDLGGDLLSRETGDFFFQYGREVWHDVLSG